MAVGVYHCLYVSDPTLVGILSFELGPGPTGRD